MCSLLPIMLKHVNACEDKRRLTLTCQEWSTVSERWVYAWSLFSSLCLCFSVSFFFLFLRILYSLYHQKNGILKCLFFFFQSFLLFLWGEAHSHVVGQRVTDATPLESHLDTPRRVEAAIPLWPRGVTSRPGSSVENVHVKMCMAAALVMLQAWKWSEALSCTWTHCSKYIY